MKNLLRGLMFCFAVFACCTALALVICGACGHEVADEQRFCGHCGARVGDDKPAAEDVAATAETVPSPVDLQTVLDAAREDSRMAAEIEEGLPEVALCYYRNAAALARLLPDGTSRRLVRSKGQKAFRAQEHFYQQARKAAKAREHERAMTFEPHVPAE